MPRRFSLSAGAGVRALQPLCEHLQAEQGVDDDDFGGDQRADRAGGAHQEGDEAGVQGDRAFVAARRGCHHGAGVGACGFKMPASALNVLPFSVIGARY
eukprot:2010239-Pyramimonas_sp.AAC.1